MMRKIRTLKGQKGLSLIEVTIMLLVLMLLTGVLAPEMWDFIKKAQYVKVKEDCEAIAISIIRLKFDVGCLKLNGALPCKFDNHPYLLHSAAGTVPDAGVGGNVSAAPFIPGVAVDADYAATFQWDRMTTVAASTDTLEDQLSLNTPLYPVRGGVALNPFHWETGGWHGAYITPPIGPDPWGDQYVVNSVFIDAQGTQGGKEGSTNHGWNYDSFCLSAGPNRYYETPFAVTNFFGSAPVNDDFLTVITAFSH